MNENERHQSHVGWCPDYRSIPSLAYPKATHIIDPVYAPQKINAIVCTDCKKIPEHWYRIFCGPCYKKAKEDLLTENNRLNHENNKFRAVIDQLNPKLEELRNKYYDQSVLLAKLQLQIKNLAKEAGL